MAFYITIPSFQYHYDVCRVFYHYTKRCYSNVNLLNVVAPYEVQPGSSVVKKLSVIYDFLEKGIVFVRLYWKSLPATNTLASNDNV